MIKRLLVSACVCLSVCVCRSRGPGRRALPCQRNGAPRTRAWCWEFACAQAFLNANGVLIVWSWVLGLCCLLMAQAPQQEPPAATGRHAPLSASSPRKLGTSASAIQVRMLRLRVTFCGRVCVCGCPVVFAVQSTSWLLARFEVWPGAWLLRSAPGAGSKQQ